MSVLGSNALCITPPSGHGNATIAQNELHRVQLTTPWSGSATPLLRSGVGEPFLSAAWHPETANNGTIGFSTVAQANDGSRLAAFWGFRM